MYKILILVVMAFACISAAQAGRSDKVFFGKDKGKEVISYDRQLRDSSEKQLKYLNKMVDLIKENNILFKKLMTEMKADAVKRKADNDEIKNLLKQMVSLMKAEKKASRRPGGFRER